MSYILLRSAGFIRDARRFIQKHPHVAGKLRDTLLLLEENPHTLSLRTHKLKGHQDSWACSGGYDLRIIFSFTNHADKPAILLEALGTHDEVY